MEFVIKITCKRCISSESKSYLVSVTLQPNNKILVIHQTLIDEKKCNCICYRRLMHFCINFCSLLLYLLNKQFTKIRSAFFCRIREIIFLTLTYASKGALNIKVILRQCQPCDRQMNLFIDT